MFEPAWSARTAEEDPGAPLMNESTKYVVSSTMKEGTWQNTKIVGPYSAEAIRRVKAEVDDGVYGAAVPCSSRPHCRRPVDELHLFVYPVLEVPDRACSPTTRQLNGRSLTAQLTTMGCCTSCTRPRVHSDRPA